MQHHIHTHTRTHTYLGEIPERSNGADCKSVGEAFGGSNPPLPTLTLTHTHATLTLPPHPNPHPLRGSSSFGRAEAFQASGGGFEPRLPLKLSHPHPLRRCSSVVEHFLGKEGVMSSTLIIGSTSINKKVNCN